MARQERDLNADQDFADSGEQVWYHSNTLHSVYALSDASESVIERYKFDAYGAATVLEADGASDPDGLSDAGNPYLFTSRRADLESGLMQYRYREYDRTAGRFISRDAVGYTDGLNLYEHAMSRPSRLIDPMGLRTVFIEIVFDPRVDWENLYMDMVDEMLNEVLAPCQELLEEDDIRIVLRERSEQFAQPGWRYTRYSHARRLPWWGWANPWGWAYAAAETPYNYFVRKPSSYTQWVSKGRLGVAQSSGAHTRFDVSEFVTLVENAFPYKKDQTRTIWSMAYANVLAHEILWIGILGKTDIAGLSKGAGDIWSPHGKVREPVMVDDDYCCELIEKLKVK